LKTCTQKNQRCSRPLCSSQGTGGTIFHRCLPRCRGGSTGSDGPSSQSFDWPEVSFRPSPQDPTVCLVRVSDEEVFQPEGVLARRVSDAPCRCSIHEPSRLYSRETYEAWTPLRVPNAP